MKSELTHETTNQFYPRFSKRWNERLVHAGVGGDLFKIPNLIIFFNSNTIN